jgi:hypothetical protein
MARNQAEIDKQVRENFSNEEIDRFMKICIACVEKTVLHTVSRIIDDIATRGDSTKSPEQLQQLHQLARDVFAVSTQRSQPFVVEVNHDGKQSQILINLAPCKPDWKTRVAVPTPEIAQQVYAGYDYLRRAAHVYWNYFAKTHTALCDRIVTLVPDIDWKVKPEPQSTMSTMWFDQTSPHHMGLVCALVDDGTLYSF